MSFDDDEIAADKPKETLAGLITSEIAGKKVALARYDSILWKIRSGYIVVLYGALGMAGKDVSLASYQTLVLIVGFSVLGCVLDQTFTVQKLRVVQAINLLANHAVDLAMGKKVDVERVRNLLHISGHSSQKVPFRMWRRDSLPVLLLYCLTPLFATAIRYVHR